MSTQASDRPGEIAIRGQLLARREKLQAALAGRETEGYFAELMNEVDAALARLADGNFGLCETCHDPIEPDRLASDPLTRFCLDHLTGRERSALEQDLAMSARIQAALLPRADLSFAGWEVAYHYQPASVVSGDYCDVIPGAGELLFLLGDVSGKGVAASILMAHLHAMFRSLITVGLPLGQMLTQANRLFCESTMPNSFATLVCGRATAGGEVEIANAGHCPPLVKRPASVQNIGAGGLPLGLFCEGQYQTETIGVDPGDRLVLYTDGLSEARNASDAEYGTGRIKSLLATTAAARSSADVLIRDWTAFRGPVPQHDDVTLMVIRRSD